MRGDVLSGVASGEVACAGGLIPRPSDVALRAPRVLSRRMSEETSMAGRRGGRGGGLSVTLRRPSCVRSAYRA